jgi:hypothetical protein
MDIYVVNIETTFASGSTKNIGVFANEKLAKQAAKKYVEEHTLDVKKKRAKKDEMKKVLYVENTVESPFAITMTLVGFNLEEIMEKQSRILKEIDLTEQPIEQQIEQAPLSTTMQLFLKAPLYKRRNVDLDDKNWLDDMEKVKEEAKDAVSKCFQKEKFKYVIVECDYTCRFDEGEEHADDFVDLNAVCTESRINPKLKKDAKYITSTFDISRSIVFKKTGFKLRDLMDVGHCGCFDFGNLMTIKKVDNVLMLHFDTESG